MNLLKFFRWVVVTLCGLFLLMVLSLLPDIPGCKRFNRYASYKSLKELTEAEAEDIQRIVPFQQDGSNYTAVLVRPCRSLASGPAVLIYNEDGKLIDRNLDIGDYGYRSGRGRNDWKFSPWSREDVADKNVGQKVKRLGADAKKVAISHLEKEDDGSKTIRPIGSPGLPFSSPTNTNSGLFGGHDVLVAKGLVAIKTIKMPKMTFERKPLSDILSSVYKQCNLRLTEEWGFGVGLSFSGVDLNERYNFEIPELSIYEVFLFIAQRVDANVRYEDGRIYMEGLRDERN